LGDFPIGGGIEVTVESSEHEDEAIAALLSE
jgi:hypothetical protein